LNLYRNGILQLESHCRGAGLLPPALPRENLLDLAAVPRSLRAVRASDAYSARPGHPARGGTFYVAERPIGDRPPGRSLDYRMTTAHETWPGHHLLDLARWSLDSILLRSLERPLFYEGWACLGESLMAQSGYFTGEWDAFILAARRYRRAMRGRVDLGIQSGRMTLEAGAQALAEAGFSAESSRGAVRKYALRPGYQVCYTVGLRRFLALYGKYGGRDTGSFFRTVLSGGQTSFEILEDRLRRATGETST
jgi:uncharacterized protein (DUF885 family)